MNFAKAGSKWLWHGEAGLNRYVLFRKNVTLKSTENVFFMISCDTNYVLKINGEFVGCGQYLALPENKFFDKISIDKFLKKGANTIDILVYYQGVGTQCYVIGEPGLIYCIKTPDGYISNEGTMVADGASGYVEGEIPLISMQCGPSFEFDARKTGKNIQWEKAEEKEFGEYLTKTASQRPVKMLDLSKKSDCRIINKGSFIYGNEETVAPKMMNAYMKFDEHTDCSSIEIDSDNTYITIDMGKECAGYFEMDIEAAEGTVLDIAYGEHMAAGRVAAAIHSRNFAFRYTAKAGKNKFTHYFRRIAGRYLQINFSNVTEKVKLNYAGIREAVYPLNETKFEIKDKLHSKIYKTCLGTLKICMHEHYEDTPWREQCLYGFDSRNQMLYGYDAFGEYKFAKASIELLESSLGDDGIIDMCVPSEIKLKIPSFSIMWMVGACEYVLSSGDTTYGKHFYKIAEKILDIYKTRMENGLYYAPQEEGYWNFYDWEEGLNGIENDAFSNKEEWKISCMYNLLLCYAMKKIIEVGKLTEGKTAEFKSELSRLKTAINETFYEEETGLYRTYIRGKHYSSGVQALAVCTGVAENPKNLRKQLAENKELVPMGLCMLIFKYEALFGDKKYYDYILDDIAEIWGNMLYSGAATFYETAKGYRDFDYAGSLSHGWAAAPVYVYHRLKEKGFDI